MAGQNHNEDSQKEITNNGIEPVNQEDATNSEGGNYSIRLFGHFCWSVAARLPCYWFKNIWVLLFFVQC